MLYIEQKISFVSRAEHISTRERLATRTCVKVRFSALDAKCTILSAVHRKLALSMSFLLAESLFSRIRAVKFYVCGNSIFRKQNDTNLAKYRLTSNKKYRSYHLQNVFQRASVSRLDLALKFTFPYFIRNVIICPRYTES